MDEPEGKDQQRREAGLGGEELGLEALDARALSEDVLEGDDEDGRGDGGFDEPRAQGDVV